MAFFKSNNITSVNIGSSIRFVNNSMYNMFANMQTFNGSVSIPNSITNMSQTFDNCFNFNQSVAVPNNVTNMCRTFYNCRNFNQPITIPNSVTNLTNAFYYCTNFNQPITVTVPKSLNTNITYMLYYCSKLRQPVVLDGVGNNFYCTFNSVNTPVTITNINVIDNHIFNSMSTFNSPLVISNINSLGGLNPIFNRMNNFRSSITFTNIRYMAPTVNQGSHNGIFAYCNNWRATSMTFTNVSAITNVFGPSYNSTFPIVFKNCSSISNFGFLYNFNSTIDIEDVGSIVNMFCKGNIGNPTYINIKNVKIYDGNQTIKMELNVKSIDYSPTFKDDYFELDTIMRTFSDVDVVETSYLEDSIFPLFIPTNTKLTNSEKITTDVGERIIMTFSGDKPFLLVEETANVMDEFTIIPTYGEPFMFMDTLGVMTDNSLSWTSGGIEYYLVSDVMGKDELIEIAQSISAIPTMK